MPAGYRRDNAEDLDKLMGYRRNAERWGEKGLNVVVEW